MKSERTMTTGYSLLRLLLRTGTALLLSLLWLATAADALALTITPNTWNVIGLDSNTPEFGPNRFPVGVKVCGGTVGGYVQSTFNWDTGGTDTGTYINLRSGSLSAVSAQVGADGCAYGYFEVEVGKNASAFDKARRYHITAEECTTVVSGTCTATNPATQVSTTTPRELYVEHLVSQGRNGIDAVKVDGQSIPAGGSMNLLVNNTYTIEVTGHTAPGGYNQFEEFINIPNTIFRINSVSTTYMTNNSPYVPTPNKGLYADACGWENDPSSVYYRSCVGGDYKAGGDWITTVYSVTILSGGGTSQTLGTLLYDLSGGSYHYNSDFSTGFRIANIINPTTLEFSKAFSPNPTGSAAMPGTPATTTLAFTITNPNAGLVSGLTFTDVFPTSPTYPSNMTVTSKALTGTVAVTNGLATVTGTGTTFSQLAPGDIVVISGVSYIVSSITSDLSLTLTTTYGGANASGLTMGRVAGSSCGGSLTNSSGGTLSVGNGGISLTGGTVQANGSCVVTVQVAVTAAGSYYNATSGNLYAGTWDTTKPASATLTVTTTAPPAPPPSSCSVPVELAKWTFSSPTGTAGQAYSAPYAASSKAGDVALASTYALYGAGTGSSGIGNGDAPAVDWQGPCSGGGSVKCADPSTYGNTWGIRAGWPTSGPPASGAATTPYFEFDVDTQNYGGVGIRADYDLEGNWSASDSWYVYSYDGTTWSQAGTAGWAKGTWQAAGVSAKATTTGTTTTKFRIMFPGIQNSTAVAFIDEVVITGCPRNKPPEISKKFVTNPVVQNGATQLRFVITNPNQGGALTGVTFTDTLPTSPAAMVVANPPSATTSGCGTPTFSPAAGAASLSFSGGTIAAGGSCVVTVNVTAPGRSIPATVQAITSDTQLTLSSNFTGTTATGLTVSKNITSAITGTVSATNGNATVTGSGTKFLTELVVGDAIYIGTYRNLSSTVTSTGTAGGSAATDTLTVTQANPRIALLKEVGASASGPWYNYLPVSSGNVYYQFSVWNDGDVALSSVTVTDSVASVNTLLSSCTWTNGNGTSLGAAPFSLPVAAPGSSADFAYCTVGPVATSTGEHTNTASVDSVYGSTHATDSDWATYATTGLTLAKSVTESYFNAAGGLLHYSYAVTNSGAAALSGPVTISDYVSSTTPTAPVVVSCPSVTTAVVAATGNPGNGDGYLDSGEKITCTATYTVRAEDMTAGQVVNSATASTTAFGAFPRVTSNSASKTVTKAMPALTVVKSYAKYWDPVNLTSNPKIIPGSLVDYTITVVNSGPGAVDNNATTVIDPIPANTELYVNDVNGGGSGPVHFFDGNACSTGTLASGLTYTFSGLPNTGDNVSFSKSGGATYDQAGDLPSADGNGCDGAVTHLRIKPGGTFNGASGSNTSFCLRFRVRIK